MAGEPVKHRAEKRRNFVHFKSLVPSIITTLALCAGLSSFRFALDGHYVTAVQLIFLAALLDGIDGRVARALNAESKIGVQLDSLADFFNFGVAPIMLIYVWELDKIGQLGWMAVVLYAVCAALRLAKFNVMQETPMREDGAGQPVWTRHFFAGVPSPAAGIMVLSPLYLSFLGLDMSGSLVQIAGLVVVVSLLMVSSVPTFSLKHLRFRIHRGYLLPVVLFFGLLAAALIMFPWIMILLICGAYLLSIPFAVFKYRQFTRASEKP